MWRNIKWYWTIFLTKVSKKHANADLDFLIREISNKHVN